MFFHPIPGNDLFICVPVNVPDYFREVWVPLFVHEVLLMALAVYKGIQVAREHGKGGYMSRFTLFLVKDSVLYYFSVFGAFFSLELVWAIGGVSGEQVNTFNLKLISSNRSTTSNYPLDLSSSLVASCLKGFS